MTPTIFGSQISPGVRGQAAPALQVPRLWRSCWQLLTLYADCMYEGSDTP